MRSSRIIDYVETRKILKPREYLRQDTKQGNLSTSQLSQLSRCCILIDLIKSTNGLARAATGPVTSAARTSDLADGDGAV